MAISVDPDPDVKPERWRKKPVMIEAMELTLDNVWEVATWCGGTVTAISNAKVPLWVKIPTLEGVMRADIGDRVIRGVQGEFYSCKPDIFTATYEKAETDGTV